MTEINLGRKSIDEYLFYRNRTLRVWPGKLLLGPTGKRLFADYLDKIPGFLGRIDFIHKLNLPGLFTVSVNGAPIEMDTAETIWYPSHLHMDDYRRRFEFHEDKFITDQDIAVSVQTWKNLGPKPLRLQIQVSECFRAEPEEGCITVIRACVSHEINLVGAICSSKNALLTEGLLLLPGTDVTFAVAAALGEDQHETKAGCAAAAKAMIDQGDWVQHQAAAYDHWFDDVPIFSSSDPLLDVTWWYRWFILRHNWAEPNMGNFHHGVFYEGRSHKNDKTLYAPYGHEFSQLSPMSTSDHLVDARWKHDPFCCEESAQTLLDSMDQKNVFRMMMIDKFSFPFGNFDEWGLYQFALVHRDTAFIRKVLPGFKENVLGMWDVFKNDDDDLQIAYNQRRTGKEFQPSFWYFIGFPDNAMDDSAYDFLKRVDLSVYLYMNALGTARLCEMVHDPDAHRFFDLAQRLKSQILEKMWDEKTGFFYDLHHKTEEKAMVKNVVGIYPLWAGITGKEHLAALAPYFDENEFATGSAFASVSRQCPVFMPMGSWKNQFFKGRDGCMWDGPSWPYTTCIALDAIAGQSKRNGHAYDREFGKFLRQYARQHFRNGSLHEPYLVEHYNAITGEPLSDEVDYAHSFFIDLIVRHVAGLEPNENGFTIDPVDMGLDAYCLTNVMLRGHALAIRYSQEEGLSVTVDEKCVHQGKDSLPFTYRFE